MNNILARTLQQTKVESSGMWSVQIKKIGNVFVDKTVSHSQEIALSEQNALILGQIKKIQFYRELGSIHAIKFNILQLEKSRINQNLKFEVEKIPECNIRPFRCFAGIESESNRKLKVGGNPNR
jgi:hypothetical protein